MRFRSTFALLFWFWSTRQPESSWKIESANFFYGLLNQARFVGFKLNVMIKIERSSHGRFFVHQIRSSPLPLCVPFRCAALDTNHVSHNKVHCLRSRRRARETRADNKKKLSRNCACNMSVYTTHCRWIIFLPSLRTRYGSCMHKDPYRHFSRSPKSLVLLVWFWRRFFSRLALCLSNTTHESRVFGI